MTVQNDKDWVRQRGDCTPHMLLDRLHRRLSEDADKLNELPDESTQYAFIEVRNIDKVHHGFRVNAKFPTIGVDKETPLYSINIQGDEI